MNSGEFGDPEGMRKADNWIGEAGRIGEYRLANGKTARCNWEPIDGQYVHVIIWLDYGPPRVEANVPRMHAARKSERILAELEAE